MVLVFISSVLTSLGHASCPNFMCAVCFQATQLCVCACMCVCVYVRVKHFFSPVCARGTDSLRAEGRGGGQCERRVRRKLCEVSDISPTNPAGCETSQRSDLTSPPGIHSFFLSLLLFFSLSLSLGSQICFFFLSLSEHAEMPHECVCKNEKHMGSVERNTLPSLQKTNVGFSR